MGKILAVIGATGKKSGGAFSEILSKNLSIVNQLFSDGVRFLVRNSSNTAFLTQKFPDSEIMRGELGDDEYLNNALSNVDTVVNIAGIQYSEKIVKAAVACNVRRLILVHTTGIYSKYKEAGEEYRKIDSIVYDLCKQNNILLTICRPTMIYGNVHDNNVVKFIKMVDKFAVMPVVNGARYELQPVHYTDLAKAYYDILINEEKTANHDYVLSGGAPIQLRTMLTIIGKHLGKKVKFVSCPFFIAYFGSLVLYYCSFKKRDYREKVQRLCEPRVYSFGDAAKDFGYAPMTFDEGIAEEVKQYKSQKS